MHRNCKEKVHFNNCPTNPPSNVECDSKEAAIVATTAIVSVQSCTLKQSIKEFGDDAQQAAFKEVILPETISVETVMRSQKAPSNFSDF